VARIALYLGMFNMLGIQNQQTYDFAAMANTYLFTMMALVFVYLLTYITRSSRQEKAFLIMLRRFFRSSEFLVGQLGATRRRVSFLQRMRLAYHRQQVHSLPAKLGAWGRQIDRQKFPANSQEQVARLVANLQVVAYRIEDLIAAYSAPQADTLIKPLQRDIKDWRLAIEQGLKGWAERPDFNAGGQLQNRVLAKLQKLDVRISAEINKADAENQFSEAERLRFYHLLGAFRSLSQAAVAYVGQAGNINWNQWREERF
jgi:hypothetical protein